MRRRRGREAENLSWDMFHKRKVRTLYLMISIITLVPAFLVLLWYVRLPQRVHKGIYHEEIFQRQPGEVNGRPYEMTLESSGIMLEPGKSMSVSSGSGCHSVMFITFGYDFQETPELKKDFESLRHLAVMRVEFARRAIGIEKYCKPGEERIGGPTPWWTWLDVATEVRPVIEAELRREGPPPKK
jgi:hypothetical protein